MTEQHSDKVLNILCLNCANIFPNEASLLVCPDCGKHINDICYNKILSYAKKATLYGYEYRKKYETQLSEKGSISTRYLLFEPSTILCFCAVAALSGIIGGISYDIVKKVIQKIIEQFRHEQKGVNRPVFESKDDPKIDIFIQYIENYYFDLTGVDSNIKSQIFKERFIDEMSNALGNKFMCHNISKKEILDAAYSALEKITSNEDIPSKEDFFNLWKGLKN